MTGGQGATGFTGAQGSTELAGLSGPAGAAGATGRQGVTGATGAQGPTAGGSSWASYRDYNFNLNRDDILSSDGNKAREIADYVNQNPSARIAIDGSSERRVGAVRNALLDAGVPSYKIQSAAVGDPQRRNDRRVEVFVTRN